MFKLLFNVLLTKACNEGDVKLVKFGAPLDPFYTWATKDEALLYKSAVTSLADSMKVSGRATESTRYGTVDGSYMKEFGRMFPYEDYDEEAEYKITVCLCNSDGIKVQPHEAGIRRGYREPTYDEVNSRLSEYQQALKNHDKTGNYNASFSNGYLTVRGGLAHAHHKTASDPGITARYKVLLCTNTCEQRQTNVIVDLSSEPLPWGYELASVEQANKNMSAFKRIIPTVGAESVGLLDGSIVIGEKFEVLPGEERVRRPFRAGICVTTSTTTPAPECRDKVSKCSCNRNTKVLGLVRDLSVAQDKKLLALRKLNLNLYTDATLDGLWQSPGNIDAPSCNGQMGWLGDAEWIDGNILTSSNRFAVYDTDVDQCNWKCRMMDGCRLYVTILKSNGPEKRGCYYFEDSATVTGFDEKYANNKTIAGPDFDQAKFNRLVGVPCTGEIPKKI